MNFNLTEFQLSLFFGLSGLLGPFLVWIFNLKSKNLAHEQEEKFIKIVDELKKNVEIEFAEMRDRFDDKVDSTKGEVRDFENRVLSSVNGKYVRTDLFNESISNLNRRIDTHHLTVEGILNRMENNFSKISDLISEEIKDIKNRL